MKVPNNTLSTQTTAPPGNSQTNGSIALIAFGVISTVLLVILIGVLGICFLIRRKIFTKCFADASQCTADNINLSDLKMADVKVGEKTKDAIEEDVAEKIREITDNAEVNDRTNSLYVNYDSSAKRYVKDPTTEETESNTQSQGYTETTEIQSLKTNTVCEEQGHGYDYAVTQGIQSLKTNTVCEEQGHGYDYAVTQNSGTTNSVSYDYIDKKTLLKQIDETKFGYINEDRKVAERPPTDTKINHDDQRHASNDEVYINEIQPDNTAMEINHTNKDKTRKKKLHQNAPTVGKSSKPMKSDTKGVFETSKRSGGKRKTQRAEREANKYKRKDGGNPLKKKVDVTRGTEVTLQSDLYEDMNQTSCNQSKTEKHSETRKTNGPRQNELGSNEYKSPPNIQQNYENVVLRKSEAKENGTEHECKESDYANISPTSSVSTESNATDSSTSPDELHGNTIIYKAKKVNIIKMYSINDEK